MQTDSVRTNGTEYEPLSGQELADQMSDIADHVVRSKYARLLFIGQAWIDGKALPRDDMGYAYCVPLVDLWSGDDGKFLIERLNEPQHPHYVSDDLRHHKNAPAAVQEYNGPFKIKVSEVGIEQDEMQTDDSDPYTPCPRCNARDGFTWTESVAVLGDVHTAGSGRPMPETERATNVHSKGNPACNNCGDEITLGEFSD